MKQTRSKKEYVKEQAVHKVKEPAAVYKTTSVNTVLKNELHKAIDTINDVSFLKAVHVIIKDKLAQVAEGTPMTLDEFYARNARSQEEIKAGKLISHDELKKRFSFTK